MSEARSGDTVRINYTGKLTDGTQFDSSVGREPLEFQLGSGMIISGLDRGVEGMKVGDKQTVTVPAEEAYGAHDAAKVQKVPRTALPPELEPQQACSCRPVLPRARWRSS
ncbi:FKBP-type peptidyl-prolyl isomerase-like protein [Hoeflea marina]|uniref:Peptidyl-prolyl cis-trans isomerase n=1 Tax=Hoeflea marina TaxID=274592 RepID=A0A317PM57_9HYPH|nr:FKBP-type peptidyl-prolyl isomerase-like protein [Hoeflea marina]